MRFLLRNYVRRSQVDFFTSIASAMKNVLGEKISVKFVATGSMDNVEGLGGGGAVGW